MMEIHPHKKKPAHQLQVPKYHYVLLSFMFMLIHL